MSQQVILEKWTINKLNAYFHMTKWVNFKFPKTVRNCNTEYDKRHIHTHFD